MEENKSVSFPSAKMLHRDNAETESKAHKVVSEEENVQTLPKTTARTFIPHHRATTKRSRTLF